MSLRTSGPLTALALAAWAGAAPAQSFNIDVANLTLTPTTNYGAAAGQPGFWNALTGGPPYAAAIKNLAGTMTSVTTNVVAVGNGLGDYSFNNAMTSGDDEALMDDLQDVGNGGVPSSTTWTFAGLANSNYNVYVYAWAPDSAAFVSFVSECSAGVASMVGGTWPGGFSPGVTHTVLATAVSGGMLEICVDSGGLAGNFAGVNGFQFVQGGSAEPGTPVCFGATGCPCLNNGTATSGCANGTGNGGVLSSSGTASVTADTMSLTANGVINNNGLFFQGNNTIAGGSGQPFGDGIRCCGGSVVRIQVVNPPGTTSPATAQMTETATTNGPPGTITAGTKKCYQFWYRDPTTSPCGTQFNLTNAVTVTWQP